MNKGELKEALHKRLEEMGFPSPTMAQTSRNVDAIFDIMSETLESGEEIAIQGFATISVIKRDARKGRNVRTGEEIMIPAKLAPRFKASKALKERVNKNI